MPTAQPIFSRHGTLVANTVASIELVGDPNVIHVKAFGAGTIYGTIDGAAPVVGGDGTFRVDSGGVLVFASNNPGTEVVRLISAATPDYSVEAYRS